MSGRGAGADAAGGGLRRALAALAPGVFGVSWAAVLAGVWLSLTGRRGRRRRAGRIDDDGARPREEGPRTAVAGDGRANRGGVET